MFKNKLLAEFNKLSEGNKTFLFFILLFVYLILIMRSAFGIDFFLDDFFFLKISKANSVLDFFGFFSPFKDYFYRPIPTEVFYFVINSFNKNLFVAHSIVFIFYFLGLFFLFKITKKITKNSTFSFIFIFIYAISQIHVFQLYQLATFIEISLFTFLVLSFYTYINNKYLLSILFFLFALMSKETAVLFPVLILLYETFFVKKLNKKLIIRMFFFLILSFAFILVYKDATSKVLVIDTYKLMLSPKLVISNLGWYLLWSLGVPNFVPNYMQSVFFKPTIDFWNLLTNFQIKSYFYVFVSFYSILIPTTIIVLIRNKKNIAKIIFILLTLGILFTIFISPTLPIVHKWMVRLTLPTIFISVIYSIIIYLAFKNKDYVRYLSIFLIVLYFLLSTIGIKVHESSGLFLMNSQTIKNFRSFLNENKNEIKNHNTIYFISSSSNNFGGSIELKNMLGTDYFTDTFFPGEEKKIIYGHENKIIPPHSFVIESKDISEW